MMELILNAAIPFTVTFILGGVFAYFIAKYKGQKAMATCVNGRLDSIDERLDKIEGGQLEQQQRDIINTYRFYKIRKKIPIYEMEAVEKVYKKYSEFDNNGIIKRFMEQMRTWTTSDEE